jgi:ABC-type sugar transport system substrate-binding protein
MIRKHRARISYVHLKRLRREPFAFTPLDEGDLDNSAVIRALAETNYSGWIAAELDAWPDPASGAARSLAFMKRNIAAPEQKARRRERRSNRRCRHATLRARMRHTRKEEDGMKRSSVFAAAGSAFVIACALAAGSAWATDPDAALASMASQVLSTGPNGEKASPASDVTLTPDEIAEVKAKHATAALVFHYGGNDWSNAQAAALKAKFKELGIDVIAVTDAGVKPEKQVADIETVMAKKPDIIVSIPVDAIATAAAYKAAADKGVKLVFMDNVPKGFAAGKDYVSAVSADNYGNGVAAAHLMAKALGGKGDIGLVFHAADFFVTRQRYDGFKKTILEQYPDIKIIAEQ